MDTSTIKQEWNDLKTSIKEEWNEITDEDLKDAEQNWDKMVDTIALKYELTKMEANDRLEQLKAKLKR
jgi:uncharacterized protein YjbJ (UPF0337 family)